MRDRRAPGVARRLGVRLAVTCALLASVPLAGCAAGARGGAGERRLTVLAAASLTEVFTRLGRDFEATHPGTRVGFSFAASSTLAQQVVQGAPADVFAAAGPAPMKQVTDADLAASAPALFARNRLVIAVPVGNPRGISGLADLARPGTKVALCAPQVPCGAAAARALAAAGVRLSPATLEQDVKATLTKLRLGEVDAALVYRTDVRASADTVTGVEFAESASAVNDYPIVVLRGAAEPVAAAQFVAYVGSPAAAAVLTGAGFQAP
jgi:molybdate transport system substrate-binding protein